MPSRNRFARTFLFSTAGIMIMAVLVIGLNFIAGLIGGRVDLTQENLYTLSRGTKQILNELDQPVKVNFYYSSSAKQMPVPLRNYARRVEDLLKEYKRAGSGHIEVQQFDPEPLSDAADAAQLDGIRGRETGMGETVYFGISVQQLGETEALPFLHPNQEQKLEYQLTRAIYRVSHPQKPVVGIISPLPVMGSPGSPMQLPGMRNQSQPPWRLITELRKDYEVREISFEEKGAIPADLDVLILIHPKNFSKEKWFGVDQYVLNGGRLMALIDPLSTADMQNQNPMMRRSGGAAPSDLGPLMKNWGLHMDDEKVVADLVNVTKVRNPQTGQPMAMPTILTLTGDAIAQDNPATSGLESLLVAFAGAIQGEVADGIESEVLLSTSPQTDMFEAFKAHRSPESVKKTFSALEERLPLAVLLRGSFKTAFPAGKPKAEKADDKTKKPETDPEKNAAQKPKKTDWLKESKKDSAVIVISDTDIVTDGFCVQTQNIFERKIAVPVSDNLTLIHNLLDLLSGDTSLMNIRSRGAVSRPFEVVNEIRAEAEQEYQDKINRLEEELAQAEQQLQKLQSGRDAEGNQKYFLSPEQKKSIKEYRKKEAQTRKELREVRKKLRKDIDALETSLKWANIALMPVLVGVGGILLAIIKREKEVRK